MFDLTGLPQGVYDVTVAQGGPTAALPGAFTVTAGPAGRVEYQLVTPSMVRSGRAGRLTIVYTNTGDTDLVLSEISDSLVDLSGVDTSACDVLPATDDPATTDDTAAVGKETGYWLNGEEGSYAMTIVGYNDAIWTDVNGNGMVDSGEKGAFLIANSWGATWKDSGFTWDSPNYLVVLAQIVMAWTPTIAFAIVHPRVDSGKSLWRHIADRFATPIKLLPLLASILIPVVATIIVWVGYSRVSGEALFDLVAKLSVGSVLLIFLDSLIRGPLGEELGWRGYLQIELNKQFSLLKSSLIVGGIWGVWHLPLWFVSGFPGVNLLLYIVFFLMGLVSFSVIIGYIYSRGGNLFYAILLHQMLNFSGRLREVDELTVLGGSSAVYVIIALVISLMSLKSMREEVAAK